MTTLTVANLDLLLEKNKQFIKEYQASDMLQLITSKDIENKECRERMLDSLQTFSNYFQKVVLLRNVLTDNPRFNTLALDHLKEEFCHNEALMAERNGRTPMWDPILESTCSWFAWKMLNTNDEEKIILVHLVLESSGTVFFNAACPIMQQYGHQHYFVVHSIADVHHEKMGRELLEGLSPARYERLMEVQVQGWSIMIAACNRIAALATNRTR